MATLTREMIVKKSQNYNLDTITQLNMWGQYLQNISIIREMVSLTSVTFSKNQIKSLKDFQYLSKLKQLSLKDNLINDFKELNYLKPCTQLRELWLEQNPISSKPGYRYIVIRYLPFLSKLDNIEISDDDRKGASQIESFENREKIKNNYKNDKNDFKNFKYEKKENPYQRDLIYDRRRQDKKYDNVGMYNKIPSDRNVNNDYYYYENQNRGNYRNGPFDYRGNRPQSQERNVGVMNSISILLKDMNRDELKYILNEINKKIDMI